jgi:hypothetical protein
VTAANHDVHANGHADTLPDATVDVAPIRTTALIAAAVGGIGFVVLAIVQSIASTETFLRDVFSAYLVGFVCWACIPFGSLALSQLGFLTTASWGVVFRRVFQANIRTLPYVAALFIPVAVSVVIGGESSPYWWADSGWEHVPANVAEGSEFQKDVKVYTDRKWSKEIAEVAVYKGTVPLQVEENQHKIHDYLNKPFFLARAVGYFLVLGLFGYFVTTWARGVEDHDDPESVRKLRGISGPGVLVWALSGTFLVTDWVMSLEPTWASSMFPVVFAMNQFLSTFAFSALIVYTLTSNKPDVEAIIKDKFRIDIGSLTFAFCMLWAYATFSQYMLIWAGNLPEEITYYRKRTDHGWEYMAYFLMLFHWLLPFVIFVFREVKTDPRMMRRLAILLLIVCATDAVWWIMPVWPHEHIGVHVPLAYAAVLMVGGVWGFVFSRELAKRPILASNNEVKFLAAWGHHH